MARPTPRHPNGPYYIIWLPSREDSIEELAQAHGLGYEDGDGLLPGVRARTVRQLGGLVFWPLEPWSLESLGRVGLVYVETDFTSQELYGHGRAD